MVVAVLPDLSGFSGTIGWRGYSGAWTTSPRAIAAICRTRSTLCLILAAVYVLVLLVPFSRSFFALARPNLAIALIAAGGCLVAICGLVLSFDSFIPGRGQAQSANQTPDRGAR
jgi:hypothetical protein